MSTLLIVSILSIHQQGKWRLIGLCLALSGLFFTFVSVVHYADIFFILALLFDFLFILLVMLIAMRQVIFSKQVNMNAIAGSICIYLLSGILWSLAYHMVNIAIPYSFNGRLSPNISNQLNDFVYYSFITLTTLGYGDIIPLSATAKSLAFLQAIFGQLYVAILIAGLVSIHISNSITKTD